MTTGNLTEQDIKDLIVKFNLDESINDLKRYYSTPTTWEIINQSRKETRHPQFFKKLRSLMVHSLYSVRVSAANIPIF